MIPKLLIPAIAAVFATGSLNAAVVYIDFGGSDTSGNWNSITDEVSGSILDAIDSNGQFTGIYVEVTSRFNASNYTGTTDSSAGYPSTATGDSFYGNAYQAYNGQPIIASSTVTFSNLTAGVQYSFTFYASRVGVADNRITRYTLTGEGDAEYVELNTSNNVTNSVTIYDVVADENGEITLDVGAGTGNDNTTGFYYLGVVEINYVVPEPTSGILALSGLALATLRRRRR
ncbi:PEP-CTERM sorting domain-containing protein [Luteolibacter pohnpeiensis]|uniref:PEP-CTERM sorting domain-containing protein n=1 Tax=Luteolibacter pohnpeiensis TaxID=454153 RepID=A0A934VUX9_9BACT|nr:PEP-CTERM sorting domain-containing protein [Luteolibacter pohnpeiensis]MBK1880969.1 PEP-CTERM sorting domain-containing protein [Luteolibacter pohnpeiensis]